MILTVAWTFYFLECFQQFIKEHDKRRNPREEMMVFRDAVIVENKVVLLC